ncbi:hypothetical protein HaLaN_32500, partial [Haematococcus lacustris]
MVYERLGALYKDYRGWSAASFCFEAARTWQLLVCGLLVGLQQGTGLQPGSPGAVAAIAVMLGAKVRMEGV